MKNLISRFVKDVSGATAIEYGLIAALLAVVIIAAVSFAGDELSETFNAIANELNGAQGTMAVTGDPSP